MESELLGSTPPGDLHGAGKEIDRNENGFANASLANEHHLLTVYSEVEVASRIVAGPNMKLGQQWQGSFSFNRILVECRKLYGHVILTKTI